MRWSAMGCDGMRWDAMGCDGMRLDAMVLSSSLKRARSKEVSPSLERALSSKRLFSSLERVLSSKAQHPRVVVSG